MTFASQGLGGGRMRPRVLAFVVCASVAFAGGAFAAPSVGLAATTPHCASSQLALKYVFFQGATGRRIWDFAFKNLGSKCTLRGFPRVVLLDKHGHALPVTVTHAPGVPVNTVTVSHGKRAFVRFAYEDGAFCHPNQSYLAYRFKFFPPKDAGGFTYDPTAKNHGVVSICKGSEVIRPVRSTAGQ